MVQIVLENTVFRDVTPSSLVEVYRRYALAYSLHLQGRRVSQGSN
jgi:hypothetical protein